MSVIYVGDKTALPPRAASDLYVTEKSLIQAAVAATNSYGYDTILDPGAGDGRWGSIFARYQHRPVFTLTGVELEQVEQPKDFSHWYAGQDYLTWKSDRKHNLIVGNPPFSLAEPFVRKSWDLLAPTGRLIFLLPIDFMSSIDRYNGLWYELPPRKVYICSRRPSFYGNGTAGGNYALYQWDKDIYGKPMGTPRTWITELFYYDRDSTLSHPGKNKKQRGNNGTG